MARLVALEGPLEGQTFDIEPGLTLGRERHNQVPMPDNRKASRDHAKVWREGPTRYALADLGSTNGTLLNDDKVSRATLSDGDRITVGDQEFRFELGEDEKPRPKAKAPPSRADLAAVLRGEARPTAGRAEGLAPGAAAIEVKQRILQYSKASQRGALHRDLSMASPTLRWILVLAVVAGAVALFFVVRGMTAKARGGGGEAPVEGS